MKIILLLSLISNVVLTYFLVKRSHLPVNERLIIESHSQIEKKIKTENQLKPSAERTQVMASKDSDSTKVIEPPIQEDIQDAGERMEADRKDFMTNELGISEEKMLSHQKLTQEFFKKTSSFWQKNPMRELSFKERRQLIELEEDIHRKLEKLHGKKNWARYQKFREDYNQQGFKQQLDEGRPFLFMGI